LQCSPCDFAFSTDKTLELHGDSPGTMGPEARAMYRAIELYTAENGMEPPHLLSTCRSKAKQLDMQRRWDSGDRRGLRVRPADPDSSKHVADEYGICWAFDLANSDAWLDVVGPHIVKTVPGARWGGNWLPKDSPHFDIEPSRRWISAATFKI